MKFTANFIPYLTFKVALLPTATAFIEPDIETQSIVSQASFVDAASLPSADTDFFSPQDNAVPNSFAEDLSVVEQRLGLEPGTTKVDGRSGKMVNLSLKKPILPGDGVGNHLLWSVGPAAAAATTTSGNNGAPVDREEWSRLGVEAVKNWMVDHQNDLQIDAANELFPSQNSLFSRNLREGDRTIYIPPSETIGTAVHGDDGDMIQISMQRTFKGVKVVDSRATATIKRGNLVNIGLETWGDIDESFDVQPRLTAERAYRTLAIHTGLVLTDEITCKPELQIITTGEGDVRSNLRTLKGKAKFGTGYNHRLVWRVCPKFEGQDVEMMEGIVDAMTGQVLSFQDTVDYFQAKGDVYPFSNDGIGEEGKSQQDWPMPYMEIGNQVTDTGGNFNALGSQTAKLTGPYVEMRDICGWGSISGNRQYGIAELTQSNGIDWGGSAGTDCTTPGYGGPANTHSSRSGFYELNKIIEIARSRLPTNTWLQGKLISWMNIDASCNAYWNGQVNFYRSSSSCANTGELAGVFDHEWGHGLDNNDVDRKIAKPSGEGIADVYTALRLNDSCIGRGFYQSSNCSGNGNPCTSCTGVRDIDYMKRQTKKPSTYSWSNQVCGTSVHCLGYVYSEAVWSLYKRELNSFYGYDENTSLEIVTRLTYIAAGNTGTWFSGSTPWGGCGANSGYLSFLAADDDNGNINDGTPHMQAIFKAFNDQEIACNTPSRKDSGCANKPTEAPVVTAVAGHMKATLTWTAVARASKYQVFRTEGLNCGQGKVLLATLNSNILSYVDEGLANKREYYYIVIPKGSNEACFGPSSVCASAIPDAVSGFEVDCDDDPLIVPADPSKSSVTTTRNCVLYGTGGFSGSVNVGCDSSSLSGISCSSSPSTVTVSSGLANVVISVVASSSAASGTGAIVVTGTSGSTTSTSTIPVTIMGAGGDQLAMFDTIYKAPRCNVWGTSCSSQNLLAGRGTMTSGNEANAPNTFDGCTDGNSGTYKTDESLEKIVVRSGWTSGVGIGEPMVKGGRATITATVYAYYLGADDFADFYYATDQNPNWYYIGTKQPSGGGLQEIAIDYQLPEANTHIVRVNYRYNGGPSPCSSGSYNDHDDLVFAVTGVPSVTSPPSKKPVTPAPISSAPSKKPTPKPTNSPSKNPTLSPTKKPTNSPSRKPTLSPLMKPTPVPTAKPTSNPTKAPVTPKPTTAPSKKPTNSPSSQPTPSPTKKPAMKPTLSPTMKPTNSPSRKPSPSPTTKPTNSPSRKPTNNPSHSPVLAVTTSSTTTTTTTTSVIQESYVASFDDNLGAPRCASEGSSCSSGTLLNGRGSMSGGSEINSANTLDGCFDGSSGTYQKDESIEKIVVRSGEIDGSGSDAVMESGSRVTIEATVFAWSSGASDTADFYYASDASNPVWQYIGSKTPDGGGEQVLKIAYNLPEGSSQAIRVQFRFGGTIGTCTYGSYNDRDDLIFAVKSALENPTPTLSPTKNVPPAEPTGGGPQQASHDTQLGVPRCSYGSECDSLNLLDGRGLMKYGNEIHSPNTLEEICQDGNSGSYHNDESIDRIVVRSGEEDGNGSGIDMIEGGRATIIATVYPWRNGGNDFADFYYASDSANAQWIYIGTKQPIGSGAQELKMSYTLPQGSNQAVRVNFRYRGVQGANGACSNGSYDDTDDLAFGVRLNPSFTESQVSQIVFKEEPKDAVADVRKRIQLNINAMRTGKRAKAAKLTEFGG